MVGDLEKVLRQKMNGKQIIIEFDQHNQPKNSYIKSSSPFKTGNQVAPKPTNLQIRQMSQEDSLESYVSEHIKPQKREVPGFVSYQKQAQLREQERLQKLKNFQNRKKDYSFQLRQKSPATESRGERRIDNSIILQGLALNRMDNSISLPDINNSSAAYMDSAKRHGTKSSMLPPRSSNRQNVDLRGQANSKSSMSRYQTIENNSSLGKLDKNVRDSTRSHNARYTNKSQSKLPPKTERLPSSGVYGNKVKNDPSEVKYANPIS